MKNNKKTFNSFSALVYSTDPNAIRQDEEDDIVTPQPSEQRLKVVLDKKKRAGKVVTLITGFTGTEDDFQELGKKIKTKCGTGGSAKDGEIIIQGDFVAKVVLWLREWGYKVS